MNQLYVKDGRLCTFTDTRSDQDEETSRRPRGNHHRWRIDYYDGAQPDHEFTHPNNFRQDARPMDMEPFIPAQIPCMQCDGGLEDSLLVLPAHVTPHEELQRFVAQYQGQIEHGPTGERRFVYTCTNCGGDTVAAVEDLPSPVNPMN